MLPHIHVSGIQGLHVFLFVVVSFGSLHLLCASFPDNRIAQGWLNLGF